MAQIGDVDYQPKTWVAGDVLTATQMNAISSTLDVIEESLKEVDLEALKTNAELGKSASESISSFGNIVEYNISDVVTKADIGLSNQDSDFVAFFNNALQ